MVDIFIYESLSAGEPLDPDRGSYSSSEENAIRQEGWGMLEAVLKDFETLPQIGKISTLLDVRLGEKVHNFSSKIKFIEVDKHFSGNLKALFTEQLKDSSHHLIIAPELNNQLGQLNAIAEKSNSSSLSSPRDSLEIFSDKISTSRFLNRHEIPSPMLLELSQEIQSLKVPFPFPWILKPAFGAGAMNTFKIASIEHLYEVLNHDVQALNKKQLVVTPFLEGEVTSASFLFGPSTVHSFPPCKQVIESDPLGRIYYNGLPQVVREPQLVKRIEQLSQRWLSIAPPLRGFVGVDMILGNDESEDSVLEINPRLTSSYLTLRRELQSFNIAHRWLQMLGIYDPVQQ